MGQFFRATREAQSLSQGQLAALTARRPPRVSRAMISAIELGRHLPGLEALLTLSQALHVSPAEVLERLELARVEPVETGGRTFDELDRLASECFWAGDVRRAAACYEAMLRLLCEEPPADAAERARRTALIELRRGAALRRCGATTAARAAIEQAITRSEGMPEIQAQAYLLLAALLVQLGRLPLARDATERAIALASPLDDVKLRGWCWIERGEVLAASGDPARAREAFLRARRDVRLARDFRHAIKVEGNLGHCLDALGRPAQARRRYLGAVALARRDQAPASEALWLVELGRLALAGSELDEADRWAAAALRRAKPNDDLLTCFRAEWLRHLVHTRRHPDDGDRHRLAYLKRLYVKLEDHGGVAEIREFARFVGIDRRTGGS
jgi:tetratricopeptide (TPR) repeat protein